MKLFSTLKHQAMVKIGKAEHTVDPEFNELAKQFSEKYKELRKVASFAVSYQASLKSLATAHNEVTQQITNMYEGSGSTLAPAASSNERATAEIDSLRHTLEANFEENIHYPFNEFKTQFKQISERIKEREKRLLDMDLASNELKNATAKSELEPSKLQAAKDRADATRAAYDELNAELLKDIPKLLANRTIFYDCLFANFVDGQRHFFSNTARILSELEAPLSQVNRQAHRSAGWVITDEASTKAKKENVGSGMPSDFASTSAPTDTYGSQPDNNMDGGYGGPSGGPPGGMYGGGGGPPSGSPTGGGGGFGGPPSGPSGGGMYGGGGGPPSGAPSGGGGGFGGPPSGPSGGGMYGGGGGPPSGAPSGGGGGFGGPPSGPSGGGMYGGGPPPSGGGGGFGGPPSGPSGGGMYGGGGGDAPLSRGGSRGPRGGPRGGRGSRGGPRGGRGAPPGGRGAPPGGRGGLPPGPRKDLPAQPQQAPSGPKCQALYPFDTQDPSELPFQYGDIINILEQDGDWWEGELNGRTGQFPSNYVRLL